MAPLAYFAGNFALTKHQISGDPAVLERARLRTGRICLFDRLVSERTAHIVVDQQKGLMDPGAVAEIAAARDIMPAVNRIGAALRQAGGLVGLIQNTVDAAGDPDLVNLF